MKTCNPGQESLIEEALANASKSLTEAQREALTTELAKPVYANMTTAQVLTALYGERSVFVPAGTRPRLATWTETLTWLKEINAKIATGQISLTQDKAAYWMARISALQQLDRPEGYTYNPRTSETFAPVMQDGLADGVVTRADIAAFLAKLVETVEEHAEIQPPAITLLVDESGNRIFPVGLVLEPSDIEECR